MQATGVLKLVTARSACCASIRQALCQLRDETTFQEIVRATVEILFAIDVALADARAAIARPTLSRPSAGLVYAALRPGA